MKIGITLIIAAFIVGTFGARVEKRRKNLADFLKSKRISASFLRSKRQGHMYTAADYCAQERLACYYAIPPATFLERRKESPDLETYKGHVEGVWRTCCWEGENCTNEMCRVFGGPLIVEEAVAESEGTHADWPAHGSAHRAHPDWVHAFRPPLLVIRKKVE